MNLSSKKLKLTLGIIYLSILFIGLIFLFSYVDIKDLTSFEFIRSNKNLILEYKNNNFTLLTISFFIFCIIWVLLLGFGMPILLFSVLTSIKVPPLKSTPKFNPLINKTTIDKQININERIFIFL